MFYWIKSHNIPHIHVLLRTNDYKMMIRNMRLNWNLMDDFENHRHLYYIQLSASFQIHPEMANLGQIRRFCFSRVTLKLDDWPWENNRAPFISDISLGILQVVLRFDIPVYHFIYVLYHLLFRIYSFFFISILHNIYIHIYSSFIRYLLLMCISHYLTHCG